jgi:peptidoglycan/LPS O-acetylase OafA/YrhL
MCGALLAFAMERPKAYAVIARLTRVPAVVPLALVVALFVLLDYSEDQFTAVAAVATFWIAYAIVQAHRVTRVLAWRPLVFLGQRSYGAYLLHFLALRLGYLVFGSDTPMNGFLSALFCLAVTIPAADLMYRAIELPAIAWARDWLDRRGANATR